MLAHGSGTDLARRVSIGGLIGTALVLATIVMALLGARVSLTSAKAYFFDSLEGDIEFQFKRTKRRNLQGGLSKAC